MGAVECFESTPAAVPFDTEASSEPDDEVSSEPDDNSADVTEVSSDQTTADSTDALPEPEDNAAVQPVSVQLSGVCKKEWLYYDAVLPLRCRLFTCGDKVTLDNPVDGNISWHGSFEEDFERDVCRIDFEVGRGRNKCYELVHRTLHRSPFRRTEYWAREGVHMKRIDTWLWMDNKWVCCAAHGIVELD